jgi:hypothetical protein
MFDCDVCGHTFFNIFSYTSNIVPVSSHRHFERFIDFQKDNKNVITLTIIWNYRGKIEPKFSSCRS